MAESHQPSGVDPGYSEEDHLGDYMYSLPLDNGDFSPAQDVFGSINPPCPTQASELLDDYVRWPAYAQPQSTTHSAPQLYSPRVTTNLHIRPYHSGPMVLSGQFAGLDTPGMSSGNDPQSMFPMNMNLNQHVPRTSAHILDSGSQSGFSRTGTLRLHEPKDLAQYDNSHSQAVTQGSHMSNARGQKVYLSTTSRPRKRPRGQNEDDWSISDGENGTGQKPGFNDSVQSISNEDEAEAIDWIERWLKKYSAKDPPRPSDIDALAILTRLPVSEVNRLLVQILWERSKPREPSTEAALPCEGNANANNPLQQLPILQSSLLPPIFERAVLWLRSRAQKCPPKQYMNLPSRDETKIYQCTLGCNQAFIRKADWMRHEIECNYPQEGWLCNIQTTSTVNGVSTCSYCPIKDPPMDHATNIHSAHTFCHTKPLKARIFLRKEKFVKHCDKFHPSLDSTEQADRAHFWIHSEFPSDCGFCNEMMNYSACYDRFEHIATHFEAGKDMTTWKQSHSQAWADDDGDGEDDDDDRNNSDENWEQNGGNLGDEDPQYYPPLSNYRSGDSGYNSKGSGQSSSNNTGSSFGSRCNTHLVAGVNLTVHQPSQEKHSHSALTVDKMIGTQHQPSEEQSILQKGSGPKPVLSPTKPLPKCLMRDDVKKPCKDFCIAHRPRHSQMRGNLQKLMDIVLSKLTLPGSSKTTSIKNKSSQPSSVTSRNEFPSGVIYDHRSLFPPSSSVASSVTLVTASLEQELSRALISLSNRKYFWPISVLDALVTEEAIERELRGRIPAFGLERSHLPSQIARTSRKLFAILVYLEKGSLITAFLDENMTDSDLPLESPLARVGQENQGRLSKVFANRPSRDINDFCRVQWYLLAPIFDRLHEHYELDDNVVLPFIENGESSAQQGGYSEVWEVKIHPAHHQLRSSLDFGKEPSFAVKRLFSRDPKEFKREVGMLRAVSKLKHHHILELLVTYKFRGRYHLVFRYAKHNLRQLWNSVPIADDAEWAAWSLTQMRGIASGLEQIHCFTPSSVRSSLSPTLAWGGSSVIVETGEERYCRHGDLKPENILLFAGMEGDHEQGLLVIADFGLARFHRLESRSTVDPKTIGGTATYAPPEVQLHGKVSRAYDIWSLGCVYLEFVTWLVGGWQDLNTFGDARAEICHDGLEDDTFFTVLNDNPRQSAANVRRGVQSWIKYLHEKPRCSAFIHEFLDLISQRMLRVDPNERISSGQLNWKLTRMLERAISEPNYLVNSKAEALCRPKEETQQNATNHHCADWVKYNPISILNKAPNRPKEDMKQASTNPYCTDLVRYNPIYGYKSDSGRLLWVLLGALFQRDCSIGSKSLGEMGQELDWASYDKHPL